MKSNVRKSPVAAARKPAPALSSPRLSSVGPAPALPCKDKIEAAAKNRWIGRSVPKRSRRDAILRSVGTVLRDSLLSSLTMQDIAVELGITKGNLYYYFKDKQDILYQCHMRCMDISLEALEEVRAAGMADPLRVLLVRHISGMIESGFGSVLLTDLDNLSAPQRTRYIAKRDEFEAGVRALIQRGISSGAYVCDDIKLAGLAMLGAINWLPKWYRPGGELSPAQIATGLTDFLMRALEPKAAAASL